MDGDNSNVDLDLLMHQTERFVRFVDDTDEIPDMIETVNGEIPFKPLLFGVLPRNNQFTNIKDDRHFIMERRRLRTTMRSIRMSPEGRDIPQWAFDSAWRYANLQLNKSLKAAERRFLTPTISEVKYEPNGEEEPTGTLGKMGKKLFG